MKPVEKVHDVGLAIDIARGHLQDLLDSRGSSSQETKDKAKRVLYLLDQAYDRVQDELKPSVSQGGLLDSFTNMFMASSTRVAQRYEASRKQST